MYINVFSLVEFQINIQKMSESYQLVRYVEKGPTDNPIKLNMNILNTIMNTLTGCLIYSIYVEKILLTNGHTRDACRNKITSLFANLKSEYFSTFL